MIVSAFGEIMMAEPARLPVYSFEQYLELEQFTDTKHEFIDGVIVAMVGTTKAHDIIVHNMQRILANYLQGTPCRIAGSDLKLRVEAINRSFYPDLMIVCSDPLAGDPYFETDAKLIVEILSGSTEDYDRSEKSEAYRLLPGLQEYWLIAQDRPEITCIKRDDQGWKTQQYGLSDAIPLLDGELMIPMPSVYERLPFISTAE
jgi:Uma2 family endonuclease